MLVPWPNRLDGGRYRFAGVEHQVPIDEPALHNAIHGLVRTLPWDLVDRSPGSVTVAVDLDRPAGYPFRLAVRVSYRLDDHGLAVTTTATNVGDVPCPYAAGQHPYLSPGGGPGVDRVDGATLVVGAATRIVTDDRQLPVGRTPVDGTSFDLRRPVVIGAQSFDDAFTDLVRDADGLAWASLTGVDGRTVALWVDRSYAVLQVYTGDHSRLPEDRRRGVAVEPMTAPANAFASGDHLVVLGPGESTTARWGLVLR